MLEILNIPDIRRQVAPITIERYHRMIELGLFDEWKVELLNGVLVEKMSKSPLHVFVVQMLFQQLTDFCQGLEEDLIVRKEDPITIGDSEPKPDLSVVEGKPSQFKDANPSTARLVIEVSISTLSVDHAKAMEYATAGIPEYWIIRPGVKVIEVHGHLVDGNYTETKEVPGGETVESAILTGFGFCLEEALKG
ncbi:MAG: Uma2 family endonuclease [Verrucomicrobiota bacterium]